MSKEKKIETAASSVSFKVKKFMVKTVAGNLSDINGTIRFDPNDASNGSFDISIPAASINTNDKKRDEHLRNQDFFSVEQYPEITFRSTAVQQENGGFSTSGDLRLLGVTKTIKIPFSFKDGIFEGNFSLNRLDYTLGKKFPSFIVGKNIDISIRCKTTL